MSQKTKGSVKQNKKNFFIMSQVKKVLQNKQKNQNGGAGRVAP